MQRYLDSGCWVLLSKHLGSNDMRTVPCTWSRGSVRFFSAGMYFNTTVSSPLYCIVVSRLSSIYRIKESFFCLEKMFKMLQRLIQGHTLGCRAYHSSIWVSSSQESKVNSTSPRNLFCPKRSWCQTETCRLRVSSCEWLMTYCNTGATCSFTTGTALNSSCSQTHSARVTNHVADECEKVKLHIWKAPQNSGSQTHPQVLVEDRVDGVGFDTRLSLAMPGCIWQQVSLHITNTESTEGSQRARKY